MKKSITKTVYLIMLLMLVLSVNVFASDIGVYSYPIETSSVSNIGTLGFTGSNSDGIPFFYNVKVSYDGKVNFDPNTVKDTIYSHHMYAIGYTGIGDPSVDLVQLVAYQNGVKKGTTTSFTYCDRAHIWPGDQKLYFDKKSSTSFTVNHDSGKLQVVVHIYENDVWFSSPTGSIYVNF